MAKVGRKKEETLPDHLSQEHLRLLENSHKNIQIAKLEMHNEEQALQNMLLSLELLKNRIDKQKAIRAEKESLYLLENKRASNLRSEIWPVYGLKENESISYNPETGKIIRE